MKTITILLLISFMSSLFAQSNYVGSGISVNQNGEDENYISLGDVYNDLAFPFTFESWVWVDDSISDYMGLFASDDSPVGNYYGLWIRLRSDNTIEMEIGTGSGAGKPHRKGSKTTATFPTNQWAHLAVVANSISDVNFYFNGLLQTDVATDGLASVSSMVHNSNPAAIGRYGNVHRIDNLHGQMDEVRLWNVARAEVDIRVDMCSKLSGTETGLIGYWNFDESYLATEVSDVTGTAPGTIAGTVDRITSSAPIGDASVYIYTESWTGVALNLNAATGDKFTLMSVQNDPHGIHLYRVDETPYSTAGLLSYTDYYFGTFAANDSATAKYKIKYKYSMSNGAVTAGTEVNARLFRRDNGADATWSLQPSTLNVTSNTLTKNGITNNFEFIFNVIDAAGGKMNGAFASSNPTNNLSVFPNPAMDNLFVSSENISNIIIYNMLGKVMLETQMNGDTGTSIDISSLLPGAYIVTATTTGGLSTSQFIKQ